ncbi:MAG: arylsulfatase A [Verrucomicrobiales bacterium]|jgi:arylsulfatase A
MKFTLCFALIFGLAASLQNISAAEKPNIVVILADDMGYGDVRALNPDSKIPTPNLDSLAKDGMTFTDAHTPSSVCTPTRYALLTGRYCWRGRLKQGVQNGYGPRLIETERKTIANVLAEAGYDTAVVGKWHLGLDFAKADGKGFDFGKPLTYSPNDHGFASSYVIPASLDFPPYIYIRDHEITEFPGVTEPASPFPDFWRKGERSPGFVFETSLHHLTEVASEAISSRAKAEKPFFLYFPLTAPHKPATPHPDFVGKTGLGPYGDFVHQVDWTVGQILKTIDDSGIRDNTIVIYSSDNGSYMYRLDADKVDHVADKTVQGYKPENHTANADWRGTKADIWEAGHHVPFFARWPKGIKAGSSSDKTICLTDVFATAVEIAGAAAPGPDASEDSFSLAPIFAEKPAEFERAPVIHHSSAGMFAIREGKWKLVLGNGSGGRQMPKGKKFERPYALFDLESDPRETKDLIAEFPEIAEKLEKRCLEIRDSGRSR